MSATVTVPSPKRLSNANVLVIDDDLGFLMYFGRLLSDAGYQPWPAHDLQEAIELVRKLKIKVDLVIARQGQITAPGLGSMTAGEGRPKLIYTEAPSAAQPDVKLDSVEAILHMPSPDEDPADEMWLETIRRVLEKASEG
jgi:CheY-like chemotaxis protein